MFNIGPSEFIVIGIIILILVRPKDLPAVLRKIAKAYRELKKTIDELTSMKDEFMKQVDDLSKQVNDVSGEVKDALKLQEEKAGKDGKAEEGRPAPGAAQVSANPAPAPVSPSTEAALAWNSESLDTKPLASFQAGKPGEAYGYDGPKPEEPKPEEAAKD